MLKLPDSFGGPAFVRGASSTPKCKWNQTISKTFTASSSSSSSSPVVLHTYTYKPSSTQSFPLGVTHTSASLALTSRKSWPSPAFQAPISQYPHRCYPKRGPGALCVRLASDGTMRASPAQDKLFFSSLSLPTAVFVFFFWWFSSLDPVFAFPSFFWGGGG